MSSSLVSGLWAHSHAAVKNKQLRYRRDVIIVAFARSFQHSSKMRPFQSGWVPVALRHGRWLLSRLGRGKLRTALNMMAVIFVAICLPWVIRFELLSRFVLIPMACLSVFLVADLVVDSFITYPHGVPKAEFTGRVISCVLLGWILGQVVIVG